MQEKHREAILHIILEKLGVEDCIIFLFGSQVDARGLTSSDIDIGILSYHEISAKDFVELENDLNTEIPLLGKIDLVDFATVSVKVRKEALKEIEVWHIGKKCRELWKNWKRASSN